MEYLTNHHHKYKVIIGGFFFSSLVNKVTMRLPSYQKPTIIIMRLALVNRSYIQNLPK